MRSKRSKNELNSKEIKGKVEGERKHNMAKEEKGER